MGKKFETKILRGGTTRDYTKAFENINAGKPFSARFWIKPPSEITHLFDKAFDVKIEVWPTVLEYEDGAHIGMNIHGFVDEHCLVEQFRGRPFKAYYHPKSIKNQGWIEIDLKED